VHVVCDVPPPYEYQKGAHEINRQDAQRAHDRLAQFHQSINEAAIKGGDAVLKALLLVNGGAAVSILAFIGGLAAQARVELDQLKAVANSLMLFALGVVAAVVGMGFAYWTNYAVAAQTNRMRSGESTVTITRIKIVLHTAAFLAVVASIALFVWGVFDVRHAIEGLKPRSIG
jgi:hypothetical protein